ncbi:MAG: PDDEXK nuclease domain-containing protein [Muribaculaceae bacterium]|nr:PDDEXK nuclease domain-containing protein [Muribaculaceae bacterium]
MAKEKDIIPISKEFVSDVRQIIDNGRKQAFSAVSTISYVTYWNIGRRIVEEEQKGNARAEYGSRLIEGLADDLTNEFGSGYNKRNLAYYRQFYLIFNDIEILHTRVQNLTWSHLRRLLSVTDPVAREWYMMHASEDMWSVKTLDRNISTQYYERRLADQRKRPNEVLPIAKAPFNESDPLEYIKNPTVAEFMGFKRDSRFSESELEQALIDNLEKFILELGRGFAFVERQQHITTDLDDFYIDLVFYNFRMKRFVIFELKTHRMTHGDVGQLDMYVRMYDDVMKGPDDNPTIGVLLCTDTDSTIAKYSVLNDSNQLFATKYMTYMPTEEELRQEIERQKQFFLDHHKND